MRRFFLFNMFFSLILGAFCFDAQAADVTVSDGPALQAALTAAQDNNEPDTIRLEAGPYDASAGTFIYLAAATENFPLTILGPAGGGAVIDGGDAEIGMGLDADGLLEDSNVDLVVQDLTFQNGSAPNSGGGLSISTGDADVSVLDCLFMGNSAFNNGGGVAAFTDSGRVLYEGNTFTDDNFASNNGGGAAVFSVVDGPVIITRNRFEGNSASNTGGAVAVFSTGSAPVEFTNNLIFNDNHANNIAGGASFFLNSGPLNMTHNTVTGNSSDNQAGGLAVSVNSDVAVTNIYNNIIRGNTATVETDDIRVFDDANFNNTGSPVNLFNNDFAEFISECADTGGCTSDISEGENLNVDPLLVDPAADLRLAAGSPVIDRGDPAAPALPTVDFDGNSRVIGPAPDMGALEARPELQVDPAVHDFGSVPQGQSASVILTIRNVGALDLELSGLTLSDNQNYALDLNGGSDPCGTATPTIDPGDACTVETFFNPQAEGAIPGSLTINSNDLVNPAFLVGFTGTGTSGGGCSLAGGPSSFLPWMLGGLLLLGLMQIRRGQGRP
jgi:hypothetical protein